MSLIVNEPLLREKTPNEMRWTDVNNNHRDHSLSKESEKQLYYTYASLPLVIGDDEHWKKSPPKVNDHYV